ncbi:MAG TPA: hypothetical protein VK559_05525 [Ferruginibacter sp.]|nr:hypothetical protein [Ferruginibacter sp.]
MITLLISDPIFNVTNYIAFLGSIVPILALIREFRKKKFNACKLITDISIIVLILLLTLYKSCDDKVQTSLDKHITDSIRTADKKEIEDSIKSSNNNSLAYFKLYIDNNGNVHRTSDTIVTKAIPIEETPSIVISSPQGQNNPRTIKYNKDQVSFLITIQGNNEYLAHNLKDTNIFILLSKDYPSIKNDGYEFIIATSNPNYTFNDDFTLNNLQQSLIYGVNYRNGLQQSDTLIDYLKIRFTNKSNRPQDPFRAIFIFNPKPEHLGEPIISTGPVYYDKIKKFLIDKKLW